MLGMSSFLPYGPLGRRCQEDRDVAAHDRPQDARASSGIMAGMRDAFHLSEDERQTRELVRAIARERIAPRASAVDEAELYPAESFEHLARAGLMGLYVP